MDPNDLKEFREAFMMLDRGKFVANFFDCYSFLNVF
jgi:hypothetical protein